MLVALDELKKRRNQMDRLLRQAFEIGMFSDDGRVKLREAAELLERHHMLEHDVVYKMLNSQHVEGLEFFRSMDEEIFGLEQAARQFYLESLDSSEQKSLEESFLLTLEMLLYRMNQKERLLVPICEQAAA